MPFDNNALSHSKNIIFATLLLSSFLAHGQKKFITSEGEVSFTSNAKLELIKASSKKIQGVIDPATGQFAFIVKVQSFEGFNSNLQREHFNEKYMEADKYYDATFTGKILEPVDFTRDGVYNVTAKGSLNIHGKKQERIIPGKIQIEKGLLKINADFTIPLVDHDITVPQIVGEKIATEIIIKLNLLMTQK